MCRCQKDWLMTNIRTIDSELEQFPKSARPAITHFTNEMLRECDVVGRALSQRLISEFSAAFTQLLRTRRFDVRTTMSDFEMRYQIGSIYMPSYILVAPTTLRGYWTMLRSFEEYLG